MSADSQLDPLAGVLIDNSFLGVIITSKNEIELINPQALKLLGYTDEELRSQDLKSLITLADSSLGTMEELFNTPTKNLIRAKIQHKDSSQLPVDISISTFQDQGSDKYVVQFADARTSELIEELKREFITKVSSDLRSPLTAISGSLAILSSERMAKLSDSVRNVVTIAERNCKRLILMVNEIIDLESLESGNIRLQPRRQDLRDLVAQAVKMVAAYCDENSVTVLNRSVSMPVQSDDERMPQVIATLLRSAIKASPKGGEVEVSSHQENGWAELKVKYKTGPDTDGTMIDASIEDALAQRSLELCKEIVALHKGFFGSEGNGAEGAGGSDKIFWVRLPSGTK
ncbi:MAG: PAS domain-containing sensor histidine kinase [Candidatus Melainabacteria bacterium]|nr:PAS domain-containing sensor histidine kinase [Candidatus Melainabacteria bacterium]